MKSSKNNVLSFCSSLSCMVILSITTGFAHAEDQKNQLGVGLSTSLDFQAYKGDTTVSSILPAFFYDNDKFYIEGDEAGFYLLNDDKNELRINAYYDGSSFDPKGSLRTLKSRKWSAMAGTSYMRITRFGGFKAQIGTDILSRSDGTVGTLSYLAELKKGDWSFYPELGFAWNDKKYNDYYYGVSAQEAKSAGISEYHPKDSIQPYANINVNYKLNNTWNLFGGLEVNYLSNQQHNSPIVERRFDIEPSLGFIFKF